MRGLPRVPDRSCAPGQCDQPPSKIIKAVKRLFARLVKEIGDDGCFSEESVFRGGSGRRRGFTNHAVENADALLVNRASAIKAAERADGMKSPSRNGNSTIRKSEATNPGALALEIRMR